MTRHRQPMLKPGPPQPPRDLIEQKFNAEMPAYRARARALMRQYARSELTYQTPEQPPPTTPASLPPRKRSIVRRVNPLQQTPEQVQAERQRIADRTSSRLEALGPCPDLAGLSNSFSQDSDVMRAATRYVHKWQEKRTEVEQGRRARLSDDVTEEIEQKAFEESLGSLKLLKKDFDDAQQRVIDAVMNPYYAL